MPFSNIDDKNTNSSSKIFSRENSFSPLDASKRQALKKIGGTALVAAIPSLSFSATSRNEPFENSRNNSAQFTALCDSEISISLLLEPVAAIRITNNTDKAIELKHVYPGIVHAGYQSFDINEAFTDGVLKLAAGKTRLLKVTPIKSTQAEADYPRHLYRQQPLRVARVTGSDRNGLLINSSRSFYA